MSRRDLRSRLVRLENAANPQPVRRSVLEVPSEIFDAGSDAINAWVAEEVKRYPERRGKFILMPEWEDAPLGPDDQPKDPGSS